MEPNQPQEPATPEEIWQILREVSAAQKKTEDSIDRLTVRLDRMAQEKKEETVQRRQETDRRMDRMFRDSDKRFKKMQEDFFTRWGLLVESLVKGDLMDLLIARGIDVRLLYNNVQGRRGEEHYEYDLVAVNGEQVVVVEVKTTLRSSHVKRFLEKLSNFTRWETDYRGRQIMGAVAYLKVVQSSEVYAEKQGLFVIRATGSSASIINHADFKPRVFKEALIKSVQDLSEHAKQKCDFCIHSLHPCTSPQSGNSKLLCKSAFLPICARKINDLQSLILTAHPCTVGTSDLIRGS